VIAAEASGSAASDAAGAAGFGGSGALGAGFHQAAGAGATGAAVATVRVAGCFGAAFFGAAFFLATSFLGAAFLAAVLRFGAAFFFAVFLAVARLAGARLAAAARFLADLAGRLVRLAAFALASGFATFRFFFLVPAAFRFDLVLLAIRHLPRARAPASAQSKRIPGPDKSEFRHGLDERVGAVSDRSIEPLAIHRSARNGPTWMAGTRRHKPAMTVQDALAQIEISGVSHVYRPPHGRPVPALTEVSLSVARREFVALLGPSGCGKSTLLYLLGGFLPIERGAITVDGKRVVGPGRDRGITFQNFALFPWKTVRGNVLYGLERLGLPRAERLARAHDLIARVGLAGFEDSYPAQLSGGMKQRCAIARMLAHEPDILLMDEPFGALDAQTRSLMQEELLALWRRSPKTVIFVTHDVQEAVYLAQRVVVMSARPGQVKAIVPTLFDHDDPGLTKSKPFVDRVDEIWHLVRGEALKAQELGAR